MLLALAFWNAARTSPREFFAPLALRPGLNVLVEVEYPLNPL
jgi:hypothetical protein